MFADEILGGRGPFRQNYIVQPLTRLENTEVEIVEVHEEFWEAEEFRYELFDVAAMVKNRLPG